MKTQFMKFTLAASIGLALAFTFSCSDGDDGNRGNGTEPSSASGGSSLFTFSFQLVGYDGNRITYNEGDWYNCLDGGVLSQPFEDREGMDYSINNKVLSLNFYNYDKNDVIQSSHSFNFDGTSNYLIGTWTRTKNKAASCETKTEKYCICLNGEECGEYVENTYLSCKQGWDITKLVVTQNTFEITYDCFTDRLLNGQEYNRNYPGWKYNIISCDTYELVKGAEKLTIKKTPSVTELTYKGKTCKQQEDRPSASQSEKACKEAWDQIQAQGGSASDNIDYGYILRKDYDECIKDFPNLPIVVGHGADGPPVQCSN